MLVIDRKFFKTNRSASEVVLQTSDGEVVVRLIESKKGGVGLGFEAPQSVAIVRRELLAADGGKGAA